MAIAHTIDAGAGTCPPPPVILLALVGAKNSFIDKRTTAAVSVFTEDIAQDAAAGEEIFGKPFHPVG